MKHFLAEEATILVVDDEQELLETIAECIKPYFQKVLTAKSGFEALSVLKNNNVNLMLIDQRMPGMTGIELMKTVLATNSLMPFVMLTGNATDPEVVDALETGVFDIMDKPFRTKILINRLQNALIMPKLVRILWANYSMNRQMNDVENFLKLPLSEQIKILYAYSGVMSTKTLKKKIG